MDFSLILYFFLFWITVSWQATMKTPLTERRKQQDIAAISLCYFLTQNASKMPHSSQNLVKPPVTFGIIPVIEPTHPPRMKHETRLNNTLLNNQTLELIYVKGEIKV